MAKKIYGRRETDPERLRLLLAVAEAARAEARMLFSSDEAAWSFAKFLARYSSQMDDTTLALMKSLEALEAVDGKAQP